MAHYRVEVRGKRQGRGQVHAADAGSPRPEVRASVATTARRPTIDLDLERRTA
jgi:hypothetical protein